MKETIETNPRSSYSEDFKSTIINALANGNSVLQEDRSDIDYSKNAKSGTIYGSLNQLLLQQVRKNNGFKNSHWMSLAQIKLMGFWTKDGAMGTTVSFYAKEGLRYHFDIYPKVNGEYDRSAEPIHKKGDFKRDDAGNIVVGNDYNQIFNVEQIDTTLQNFRQKFNPDGTPMKDINGKNIGSWENSSNIIRFENEKLDNPFPETAKPGLSYKAKDDSVVEIFAQKISEYFNSIYTGSEYKSWSPTKKQIAELQTHITDKTSPIFQRVNDAYFLATGNTEKMEKIENYREKKLEKERSMGRTA